MALGETIDVAEESLKKYLKHAGIPRDRWGDLSIVVTGAESSSYLRGAELGHVRKDESNERGLEVVVEADYYTDFDATLRHELCHVKDIMDGKIDLERKRRSSLVYSYCMYTNSEEKRGMLVIFLRNNSLQDVIDTGTVLNADLTASLLVTIFKFDTPLHDGATIVQNDKILSAGCFLPLSEQQDIKKTFGT